jgi:hypothetical protein
MYYSLLSFNPHDDILPLTIRELKYHHITQDFPTPGAHCSNVPAIVSEIVMRLLHWKPSERYQSASGLLVDLQDLMAHDNPRDGRTLFDKLSSIERMVLSDQTPPITFFIPKSLMRRGQDLRVFVSALEFVQKTGNSKCIFLSGPSGIGKTAFLEEAENYSNARRAFWVHDSCLSTDGVPYSIIAKLLEKIAVQLSEIDLEKRLALGNYLSDQLGGIGKLLTNLAPSLVVC